MGYTVTEGRVDLEGASVKVHGVIKLGQPELRLIFARKWVYRYEY